MNRETGRTWLILASLIATALCLTFCAAGPALGYPLTFDQAMRLLEIVTPVFLSYLGSATYFLFRAKPRARRSRAIPPIPQLGLLVLGPVIVFGLMVGVALFAFGYTNKSAAAPGSGMSIDQLATLLSVPLALLAATTNGTVAYLFSLGGECHEDNC